MKRTAWFLTLLIVACGGRLFEPDGGTSGTDASHPNPTPTGSSQPDASVPPFDSGLPTQPDASPPPMCGPMTGSGYSNSTSCNVQEDWMCGNDHYGVLCICPLGECTCIPPMSGKWQVKYPNGCPSCTVSGKTLAQLCGFPSQ